MKNTKSLGVAAPIADRHGRRRYHALTGVFALRKLLCILTAGMLLVCNSCSGGGDSEGIKDLPGAITIFQYGSPAGEESDVYTWDPLNAEYSGSISVNYQWKLGTANVGIDSDTFTPEQEGQYTVTVSAPGYNSKTSAPVAIIVNPDLPELTGTLGITVDDQPAAAARTGDILTAVFDGSENVSFEWFKDGVIVSKKSTANNTYLAAKTGSYTVKIEYIGCRPMRSDPVIVSGENFAIITFDLNGGQGTSPTKIIAPNTAIGELPAAPVRAGFTFMGWHTAPAGGTPLTEAAAFAADKTVYAQWRDDTHAIENPAMEKGQGFAGTIEEDGTIRFTAGAFQYKFPAGIDVDDYAYFIVQYQLSSEAGNGSGVFLRQYGNNTTYGGVINHQPWLSNAQSIQFPISGAGTSGGFSIHYNGGSTILVVKITRITFYKLPEYTVTFNLDNGTGTVPGSVKLFEGYTLGAQFPANPTKEDHTFICWKNAAGTVVTAATPIMGSWMLTAQWVLTSELGNEWIEVITTTSTSAPVYVFDSDTDTLGDYDRIIVKIKSDAAVSGRLRAWGVYALNSFTFTGAGSRPGMGNTAGDKLLTNPGLDSFNHAAADGWKEYVLPLNAISATSQTNAGGLLAIALGVIAPSGGSGTRTYYVKDLVLANEDGTKSVSALRPDNSSFWAGNGASAYVTQQAGDIVSRTILLYEED